MEPVKTSSWRAPWIFAITVGAIAALLKSDIFGLFPNLATFDELVDGFAMFSCTCIIIAGIKHHRPKKTLGWWILAIYFTLGLVAGIVGYIDHGVLHNENWPGATDYVWMVGYPFLIGGVFLAVRREKKGGSEIAGFIDALIVSTGVGLVSWVFLIAPFLRIPDLTFDVRAISMAYPMLDLVIFWIIVRVGLQSGNRSTFSTILAISMFVGLLMDTIYSIGGLYALDALASNRLVSLVFDYSMMGIACASLHSSMAAPVGEETKPHHGTGRLALLTGASLLAPGVLLVQDLTGKLTDIMVIIAASAFLFVLVVLRVGHLLRVEAATNIRLDETIKKLNQVDQELRHAQKVEAIGKLAGGIAHEINTPMQFIGDNLRFINESFATIGETLKAGPNGTQQSVPDNVDFIVEEIPRAIQDSIDGVERVTTIVRAMKAFGHPGTSDFQAVDLNEMIRNTVTVAQSELRDVSDVQLELGELPPVSCDSSEINQVLLNLVVNASHAIADTGNKGTIKIATDRDDKNAIITIKDSGTGIALDVQPRIFEPFFTTKEVGRGTGQGLSTVWALVVERHRGTVTFSSEEGMGTTFVVKLPIVNTRQELATAAH